MNILKKLVRVTPFRVSLCITLFFVALSLVYDIRPRWITLLSTLADKSLDYKFTLRGPEKPKNKIVIVGGDDKSFNTFGQWPWDRGTVFAPLIDTLCKYDARVVGFDLVWSEYEKMMPNGVKDALASTMGPRKTELDEIIRNKSGDALLRKSISDCAGRVVMGYALQMSDTSTPSEFDKRMKILHTDSHGLLQSHSKGRITYNDKFGSNMDANVDFYLVGKSGLLNVPSITPEKVAQGFFNNEEDKDGNYRRGVLFWRAGDYFVPSLTLRMAQKFLTANDTPSRIFISGDNPENGHSMALNLDIATPTGMRKVPIDFLGQAIVNYRGPNYTFPNVSMSDVLSPAETIEYDVNENGSAKHYKVHKSELFKDALVLVGITASALYDIRPRPFDPQASGVENHANILDNLLADDFLVRPTTEMIFALLAAILVGGLAFGWVIARLDARLGALCAAATIGGFLYFDQVHLFNGRNIVLFSYLHIAQLAIQYLSITVLKYMQEETEKKFIRSAFDKYVSPDVVDQMIKDPTKLKIGGDKKELSILFSDIRGFTELSERLDVKALSQFLNEYLGAMTDILQANGGTLDKYIGDAVMGFWGAPLDNAEHARLSVKTAVEMVSKLEELNKQFDQKYGLKIDIGIGINTGPVTVGNFGSSKVFSYTVIGDNVNLASRLEGVNKYYGTHVIISETTYALLKPNEFLCREVDTVKVKGKHKPVKIYEVFPDNAAHAPLKNMLKTFNDGLKAYYGRQWEQAMNFFNKVLQGREGDRPSLELIERCKHYLSNPPEADWDGSWEMHSK